MQHILIIDDDRRLCELLSRYLIREGFVVNAVENTEEAEKLINTLNFDLIVLDYMMPSENGIEFARRIRSKNQTPILMLSARAETEDRIAGLEAGVDDYLPKPFEPRELLLRIKAITKRQELKGADFVIFGTFRFDLKEQRLFRDNERIDLTRNERDLLKRLAENYGEAVDRFDLVQALGDGDEENLRAVDVSITRLRKKIEIDPKEPKFIHTVRGIGYQLLNLG